MAYTVYTLYTPIGPRSAIKHVTIRECSSESWIVPGERSKRGSVGWSKAKPRATTWHAVWYKPLIITIILLSPPGPPHFNLKLNCKWCFGFKIWSWYHEPHLSWPWTIKLPCKVPGSRRPKYGPGSPTSFWHSSHRSVARNWTWHCLLPRPSSTTLNQNKRLYHKWQGN